MRYIQMASANLAERDDENKLASFDKWTTVASGNTDRELLEDLVRSFNDELLDSENSWLRIVEDNGDITTL